MAGFFRGGKKGGASKWVKKEKGGVNRQERNENMGGKKKK